MPTRPFAACALAVLLLASSGARTRAEDLLSRIEAKKVLTVGTEARFPPFEFVQDGKIVGYSADIMAEIMKALPGVALDRLDLPFQGILPGLAAKRFDYVVTSVTVTRERYDAYRLSLPIADATMAVLKRKGDATLAKPEDIAGKVVGSQTGSAQYAALERLAGTLAAEKKPVRGLKSYVDFGDAYADLAAGRIQAVVNSLPNLLEAVRQRPDVFEVVLPTFGPKTYFAWAGRKDADSERFEALVDAELAKLNRSGKLAELQRKWFGAAMDLPADALPVPEK
ncbi:polar amino acid transport system substrate-binding protein [Methylobacterium sp. ap11]|uniref:transporter substrate-binding domain-containing protein n=1 Tax=Methylobacterium sp. ap11 TaxID=1761799 RepID=UPI0008C8E5AA|nr:transporter substrate-binding domain-containing protein [Methylobacterium sp. ap11]SEP46336.1 polar amino acid transport system substrate-binding protein [Methylobacterium sp. ap11]